MVCREQGCFHSDLRRDKGTIEPAYSDILTLAYALQQINQMRENLASLAVVPKLTPEVMARIDDIVGNTP